MIIFFTYILFFLIAFYFGFIIGKCTASEEPKEKEYEGCTQKEIDRRKKLAKISKTRKRVNGRFVKG